MPVVNGTTYHEATDLRVVDILEKARLSGQRLNIRYGDRETGRDWGDMRMVGRIGRSTGTSKIPLLISNSRSLGGPGLLEHCIVRIAASPGDRVLYQHPSYNGGPPPARARRRSRG